MLLSNLQPTAKPRSLKHELGFRLFLELYKKMNKDRDVHKLKAVGGVHEVAKALGVDADYGIDSTSQGQERFSLEDRREVFGTNTMSAFKPQAAFTWTRALLKNRFLIPLIFAALVTTIPALLSEEKRENLMWMHSIGIWILILIVVLTSVTLDYNLFLNRGKMNRDKQVFDVTVLRDGREQLIKSSELLVGDILVLTRDVPVAADGLLFVGNDLFINEESITGESKAIKKRVVENPFCYAGTEVTNGSGKMLVTAVGVESELGQIMKTVSGSTDPAKEAMKHWRSFFRFYTSSFLLGVLSFIILYVRWMFDVEGPLHDKFIDEGPVQFLMLAIGVMVVEFPEGYFLSEFLCRLHLVRKLAKDKIQVRTSDSFGWMSHVTSICFDKTGTITENMMVVVKGFFQGTYVDHMPNIEELDPMTLELIIENASLNSEAYMNVEEDGSIKFVGNQTECALLVMARKLGVDYSKIRLHKTPHIIKNYGFNSDKKMSSVIVKGGDILRLYNKGAAEMVLNKCTEYVDRSGSRNPISDDKRVELENTIVTMDREGLRSLTLTYVDLNPNDFNFGENGEPLEESTEDKRGFAEPPDEDLVLLDIIGIKDPIREGASEVVEQFKKAGIFPRMVTGDNLDTAKHIAIKCGILTSEGIAMNGPEFRRRIQEDLEGLKSELPKLQVLARSSPSDKQKLVELLKLAGEKVAVTGDGANDVRALKESAVGIAMGTSSTEVTREVADVVIMNDNISSILTFYLWSRRFALSSWGYTQFRSSLTLVVWIIVLVFVFVEEETPLSVHQFLWANFVADALVALTYAVESPAEKIRDNDSFRVKGTFKDVSYWVHILFQSIYQIVVVICIFYCLPRLSERYEVPKKDSFSYYCCRYTYKRTHPTFEDSVLSKLCSDINLCSYYCVVERELHPQLCPCPCPCSFPFPFPYSCLFGDSYLFSYSFSYPYPCPCSCPMPMLFPIFIDCISYEYEAAAYNMMRMKKNALMFNTFIFMQLFNSLNCKKVSNEYNIFEGLVNSPLSLAIRVVTIGLHLMIMLTPARTLFKVAELDGWDWLFSLAASGLVIPLSTLIRFILKAIERR